MSLDSLYRILDFINSGDNCFNIDALELNRGLVQKPQIANDQLQVRNDRLPVGLPVGARKNTSSGIAAVHPANK